MRDSCATPPATPTICGMASFPSPAEVEAATPATRDRAIDVIRIVSLLGVVVGHTVMATSTLRGDAGLGRVGTEGSGPDLRGRHARGADRRAHTR